MPQRCGAGGVSVCQIFALPRQAGARVVFIGGVWCGYVARALQIQSALRPSDHHITAEGGIERFAVGMASVIQGGKGLLDDGFGRREPKDKPRTLAKQLAHSDADRMRRQKSLAAACRNAQTHIRHFRKLIYLQIIPAGDFGKSLRSRPARIEFNSPPEISLQLLQAIRLIRF